MPKQQLNITDFTGGLNCYSDARDIEENQFAQNWNASLDKYGVIRYAGAGEKYIINHPHTNSTFVPGGGLFSFAYDNYPNTIPDSGNFDIPHEEGTVAGYTGTSLTLASTPSMVAPTNHASNDYYKDMIVSIIDGPGKGQSRKITAYNGTTKVATVAAFDNYSSSNNAISSIDGDYGTANTEAVAILRVYNGGEILHKYMHETRLMFKSGTSKYGIIDFHETVAGTSTANDPSELVDATHDSVIYSDYLDSVSLNGETTFAYASINIYARSTEQIAGDIVDAINHIADLVGLGASAFTAQLVSDGTNSTIVKITDDTKGNITRTLTYGKFHPDYPSLNPSGTIDIFQNFQQGYGLGSTSSNTVASVTANSHSLNIGDYITIAGDDAGDNVYNNTYKVLWVITNTFWIDSTDGDTSDTSMTFSSLPTSASKYVIYNIKSSGASNWTIDGSDSNYDCHKTISSKDVDTEYEATMATLSNSINPLDSKFLSSAVEVTSSNTAQDMGYLELPAQSFYPGVSYELEFTMSTFALWQMFNSDLNNTDILPGVLIYSPTAGDGTKNGVLMAGNNWVVSNEPVGGDALDPFTNKIVNGDFTDITDTSIVVDNPGSTYSAATSSTVIAVDGTAPSSSNANGKIFTTSTGLPVGVCTTSETTGDDSITLNRLERDLADNTALYTLNGWNVQGSGQYVIPLPKTEMDIFSTTSTSKSFENEYIMEQSDGGPDGGDVILLVGNSSTDYIYQDIELDGNCHYHLYFKYATGEFIHQGNGGMKELKYDIYNKETNNSLIGGWKTTDSLGSGYLKADIIGDDHGVRYKEVYYRHVNQGFNQGDSNYNFDYVTFFVPSLAVEANSVTISIRFASLSEDVTGAVGLSCVSVKKAFPDIASIVSQNNEGHIPVPFDFGWDSSNTTTGPGRKGSAFPTTNTYKINFEVPIHFKKKQDWVVRIYGGKFGYTNLDTTDAQRHSRYSPIQIVGINNIRLKANSNFNDELDKNILLLNDNLENQSKIYAYYEEYGFWDKNFMTFNTPNVDPNYIYINGMLQVSDRNFANNNPLQHYFYYKRQLHAGSLASGWISTDNVLDFITSVTSSQLLESSANAIKIPHARIFGPGGIHDYIWHRYNGVIGDFIVPAVGSGERCQYFDSDADLHGNISGKKWHYEFADYDTSSSTDYISGLAKTPQTIPVKWIVPSAYWAGGFGNSAWDVFLDSDNDGFFEHMRTNTLSGAASSNGQWDISIWVSGGVSGPHAHKGGQGTSVSSHAGASFLDRDDKHCINNPIYLPITGSDLAGSMKSELYELGYDVDEGGRLYLNKFEFDLHTFLTGVKYVFTSSNSWFYHYPYGNNYTVYWTKDLDVPRIKVTLKKLKPEHTLDENMLINFFKDNPDQYFDNINFGNAEISQSLTYPSASQSFQSHGDNVTENGTFLSYDTSFETNNYGNSGEWDLGFQAETKSHYSWSFFPVYKDFADHPSDISTDDTLIIKIEVIDDNGDNYQSLLSRVGVNSVSPHDVDEPALDNFMNLPQSFGYLFENSKLTFYEEEFDVNSSVSVTGKDIHVNVDFQQPVDEDLLQGDDLSDAMSGEGWAGRTYTLGCTTVNMFDEESSIKISDTEIGTSTLVIAGDAPNMGIAVGQDLIQDPVIKKVKIYMKDNASDIWYMQASIDTETAKAKSSSSGVEYSSLQGGPHTSYYWVIERKDLLSFNEVDSYESQTLINQKDAESSKTLTCQYKAAVHVNNRLYVGNIHQNGITYGDRMLKTPVGKFNIFPASNYIDVAIQDGDEITGLAYYKDRLLQFKKRKVFVINISGDYEYLEDTFDYIGINKQCQITDTPYGVVWVNSDGCFLYDGKKLTNLIDGKIGTKEFQQNPTGTTKNYWFIDKTDIPSVGYIDSTKKLIIARNTGPANVAGTSSESLAGNPDGFQYDFQSKGWTFLYYKLTAVPETDLPQLGYLSNFTTNKDGDLIYYAKEAPGDSSSNDINSIYRWTDDATTSDSTNNDEDNFVLRTKDFDFGSPGVRKKIYKVYVTFKSKDGASAAHSNIKVFYATNGSDTFTQFSNDSVNYSTTNGLSDGASSTGWITAELKPSSSINNIYSFALKFLGEATNIADGFEINDYTIVYRIKNLK